MQNIERFFSVNEIENIFCQRVYMCIVIFTRRHTDIILVFKNLKLEWHNRFSEFSPLDPPVFTMIPSSSIEQVEGASVTFDFQPRVPGNSPSYTFRECDHSVDRRSLRNIPYYKFLSGIRFIIQNVSVTDRGNYTCRVTNTIPNKTGGLIVEASFFLEVKSKYL